MTVARKIDILIEELKGEPRTTTELSEITGFTEDEVRVQLCRAKAHGLVVRVTKPTSHLWYERNWWLKTTKTNKWTGPISVAELRWLRKYASPGMGIRVYDYVPKKGEEKAGTIRTKHISAIYPHVVTFEEGGGASRWCSWRSILEMGEGADASGNQISR